MGQTRAVGLVALAVVLWPGDASADAGVPMIALFLPAAWLLLLPIILLEAALGTWKWGIPFKVALMSQAAGNTVSMLVGVPAAWLVFAVLELSCCGGAVGLATAWQRAYAVTVQAPWLIPYEDDLVWMVPIALAVLSRLFCIVSIVCEYPIVKRLVTAEHKSAAWAWVVWANLASYAALFSVTAVAASWDKAPGPLRGALRPIVDLLIELVFRIAKALPG